MKASVHRTFEVEGYYLTHVGAQPVRATFRIHRKPAVDRLTMGDFGDSAVGTYVAEDTIIFDLAQIPQPASDAMVIVSPTEGYKTRAAKPPQDGYLHFTVTTMTVAQIAAALAAVPPEATP